MPTLEAIATKMVDLASDEDLLGRYVDLSGLAAQTATAVNALAFGGNAEQRYAQWWLWRTTTATTADKVRNVDSYAPATGVLTHSGTAYSDTTATGEIAFLLPKWLEPYKFRSAINTAIQQIRELDETEVPVFSSEPWHWIHDLTWLEDAASIREIYFTHSPVITRNRYLQKRHTINTSGGFEPDYWTVTSNAAASPFVTSTYRNQKYRYQLQRSSSDAYILQNVSSQLDGVNGNYPAGETVTMVAVADPVSASDVIVSLSDGVTTATSTGSGTARQEYTCSLALDSSAQLIQAGVTAQTNDATQIVYEAYALIGPLTDSVRRDDYPRYRLPNDAYSFEQSGPLKIRNPIMGAPGQLIICSERSFPAFDSARLVSGAADTDSTDAPLVTAALGAISILLRGENHPMAGEWQRKFENARLKHLARKTDDGPGEKLVRAPFAAPARRVR